MAKRPFSSSWHSLRDTFVAPLIEASITAKYSRRLCLVAALLIFLTTTGVRLTAWYFWQSEAITVQSKVAENYKLMARLLNKEGAAAFWQRDAAVSNPDLLGHPPGYPFLLAIIFNVFGESNSAIQLVHILAEGFAALLIFFIALELLGPKVALIAGLLAAFSPQLSWNSILLLPDTISVLPVLLAVYLLIRARRQPRASILFVAGMLLGLACLLRPNYLFLAPFLGVLIVIFPSRSTAKVQRAGLALSLVAGTALVVSTITIRNAIVFRQFVPLSLGAGQTLLEGIADYDVDGRHGVPDTDVELSEMEAREYQRADYADNLFGPDGIKRERMRLKRGFDVIAANPFWFVRVMVQRATSMLRFERVPLISRAAGGAVGYPTVLRIVQGLFLTAILLPVAFVGITTLALAKRWSKLAALLAVPAYFLIFQSALHTEYRYIIALHYFLLVFVACGLVYLWQLINLLTHRKPH